MIRRLAPFLVAVLLASPTFAFTNGNVVTYSDNTGGKVQDSGIAASNIAQQNASVPFSRVKGGDDTNGGYTFNSVGVPMNSLFSATGSNNGLIGQVLNNVPYATNPFLPVGTTGYGQVPNGTASVAFGMYGLGEIKNSLGTVVGGEFTVRNISTGTGNNGVPPPLASPASNLIVDGAHITCGVLNGSLHDCSTGLFVSNETAGTVSTDPSFANGIIVNGYRSFGIYVEPGYTTGTQTSIEADNNGNGVNLVLKTTGTMTNGNAVMTVNKSDGTLEASIFQNGDAHFNNITAATGSIFSVGVAGGVSCPSGVTAATVVVVGGIVTHC